MEKLADLGIRPSPPPGGAGGGRRGEAEPRSAPPVPQPLILHVAEDVHAVAVSPDGTRLATASGRGFMEAVGPRVRIWNLQMGAEVRKLRLFVDAVAFSPD